MSYNPAKEYKFADPRCQILSITDADEERFVVVGRQHIDPTTSAPFATWIWKHTLTSRTSTGDTPHQLVEVKSKLHLKGYVNVYRMENGRLGIGEVWPMKGTAQSWWNGDTIACVPIDLEFEEGEGL